MHTTFPWTPFEFIDEPQSQFTDSGLSSVLRAYIFAHASTTGPTLLSFLLTFRKKGLNSRQACAKVTQRRSTECSC